MVIIIKSFGKTKIIKNKFLILAFDKCSLAQRGFVKQINVVVQMEKIKPEKAAEMLRRKGLEVTVEQAAAILEFMRKLANIIVTHHLEKLRKRCK